MNQLIEILELCGAERRDTKYATYFILGNLNVTHQMTTGDLNCIGIDSHEAFTFLTRSTSLDHWTQFQAALRMC